MRPSGFRACHLTVLLLLGVTPPVVRSDHGYRQCQQEADIRCEYLWKLLVGK